MFQGSPVPRVPEVAAVVVVVEGDGVGGGLKFITVVPSSIGCSSGLSGWIGDCGRVRIVDEPEPV